MSEISARPWQVVDLSTWGCGIRRQGEDNLFIVHGIHRVNAEHIVKCVNEHDALVAEVERLKNFLREINDFACDFPSWWFESQRGYNSFQEELDELIKECDV
jgi:hypothetical protein